MVIRLAGLCMWLGCLCRAAEYSDNPDLGPLYAAGRFGLAPHSVHVERLHSAFTTNRFGARVPVLKPGETAALLHLKYMALRGLGDLPTMLLEVAQLPYRASFLNRPEFAALKPQLPNGRLPVLEINGSLISQSATIVRYLADRAGLAGHTRLDQLKVDSLYETVKELLGAHSTWGNTFDIDALRGLREPMLTFRETSNRGNYSRFQKAAVGLATFEEMLPPGVDYLVGGRLSYADLALWSRLHELGQEDNLGQGWADRLQLPNLGRFVTRLYANNVQLASFVSSGRRMPRVKRLDGDYVYFEDMPIPQPHVPKLEL